MAASIRQATTKDNEALIALARRCPIEGHLAFYSDRNPDFFALPRLQGEKMHAFVGINGEGTVIACAVFVERKVMWHGRLVNTLHFGDLRTDPEARRSKVAVLLIKKYNEILLAGDFHHGVAEFAAGSKAAINSQKYFTPDIEVRNDGEYRMFHLVPIRTYRVSRTWQYRKAVEADLPKIAELLRDTHGNSLGAPPFSLDWLAKALSLHPSFTVAHLWVATDAAGQTVASIGLWDQSSIRQIVVTKFSRAAKFTVRLLAATGFLWRLPPLPKEGKALDLSLLRWPAAAPGSFEALKALLTFLMNLLRTEQRFQFVTIGFHETDPMLKLLEGIMKVEDRVHLYTHQLPQKYAHDLPGAANGLDAKTHYADLALS